ncbi:hypothetical protein JHK85_000797 [Glycine max]|nr:hypothetical protein JHK85_000797 [Glycine max]
MVFHFYAWFVSVDCFLVSVPSVLHLLLLKFSLVRCSLWLWGVKEIPSHIGINFVPVEFASCYGLPFLSTVEPMVRLDQENWKIGNMWPCLKPNGISKIPMAESLTCGTFAGFFGAFVVVPLHCATLPHSFVSSSVFWFVSVDCFFVSVPLALHLLLRSVPPDSSLSLCLLPPLKVLFHAFGKFASILLKLLLSTPNDCCHCNYHACVIAYEESHYEVALHVTIYCRIPQRQDGFSTSISLLRWNNKHAANPYWQLECMSGLLNSHRPCLVILNHYNTSSFLRFSYDNFKKVRPSIAMAYPSGWPWLSWQASNHGTGFLLKVILFMETSFHSTTGLVTIFGK